MANRDSFDDFENDDQDDGFLTFDARDEEEDRSRAPLVIAAIVAVLAICGIILWQLYQGGKDNGETPQIAADTGSFKAAPADTGVAPTDDLDKGVFDSADGSGAPPLDVQPTVSGAEDPLLADGGAVPAPPAQQAVASNVPTPKPTTVIVPKPAPAAVTRPSPTPAPKPVVKSGPVQVAQATPRPIPTPKVAVVAKAAPTPTPTPVPVAASTEPAAVPTPRPASSGGSIAAQLGSFQTRASADTALARYRASGLSGPVSVVAADLGAKGTWYRIRATGFDNRAEVDSFCGKARGAGAQCIPSGGR